MLELHPDQQAAFELIKQHPVCVLTGGPGTGKSTITKVIVDHFVDQGLHIALAAPSGKAAQRLAECTGRQASTIHRLLEPLVQKGKFYFTRCRDYPLEADFIALDECSMVDNGLMASFLDAVKPGARVLFVGDTDQLPSVGPGSVLKDMIASDRIATAELTQIKRQDESGLIVKNCHHIRHGHDIEVHNRLEGVDFFLYRETEPARIQDTVVSLITHRIPNGLGIPSSDIQILAPMREKTELSCKAFNSILQEKLNPEPPIDGVRFKVGDRVINTKNDYEHMIMNGDLGVVIDIEKPAREITIEFDVDVVTLPLYENHLELSYALTCVAPTTWIWTDRGLCRIADLDTDIPVNSAKACQTPVGTPLGMRIASRVIRRGRGKSVRVRTRLGLQLEMSTNHRVLVADRITGASGWIEAGRLTEGSHLAVPRGQLQGANSPISTAEFQPRPRNSNRRPCRWPSTVDAHLAELLGALVADGCYSDTRDGRVELAKADPFLSYVREAAEQLFGVRCTVRRDPTANVGRWYFHSKSVREFLLWCGLGYELAPAKDVPRVILQSPPMVQAAFLRGLFSGDGGVTALVVLSTTSAALAEQVQLLLLNLGVVAKRYMCREATENWSASWRIEITGQDIDLFNAVVGFADVHKQELSSLIREDVPYKKTNRDLVPGGVVAARVLRKALRDRDGRSYRASAKAKTILSGLSRRSVRLAYHHVDLLVDEIEDFDSLGQATSAWRSWERNRWFYDTIVEIGCGESEFYDLTVDDAHCYLSNGLISHNCHKFQGSEAPCIIMPIHSCFGHKLMQRNLLYTAISRAKRLCALVGDEAEIPKIIRRTQQKKRCTYLRELLAAS